jgi:uncharacterized Zn-binding protein involved in type VI secretion
MPPAARVGDPTAHGTPLTPATPPGGSLTVIIANKPAWRATIDVHVCPLVTGVVPHTGGVVMLGSKTVFIDGMPAARMSDAITESGPPNSIAAGCESVLIGG